MAISISPNPDRPQGRSPLEPSPTFPFDNCYHWVDCSATVRIRRCEDGDGLYDDSTAPVLSTRDHVRMARLFSEDYARMDAIAAATAQGRGHQCNDLPTSAGVDADNLPAEAAPPNSTQKHASHISLSQGLYPWDRALGAPDDAPNQATDGHPGRSPSLGDLADDFHEGDFFGLTMVDDDEFAPLVDVWFDIAEHLTAASIPSPTELFKEREEMKAIILTARMRNPHVRLPPRNGELEREVHPSQGDSDAEQIVDSHDSVD
ncbi:hypothetical protein FKP32DRAFT_539284 [Trametes sanguinea]|nr:hypothetical protein FKP32DRAFT_539284 [Trametes sanguinea]